MEYRGARVNVRTQTMQKTTRAKGSSFCGNLLGASKVRATFAVIGKGIPFPRRYIYLVLGLLGMGMRMKLQGCESSLFELN